MCGEQNVWDKACFQKDDSSGFQWCICRWVSLLISNEFSSIGQPLRTSDHFFPEWTCMGWCSMCWILDFDVPSDPLWTSQSWFSWCSKYVFFHLENVWCSKWLSVTMCIYTYYVYYNPLKLGIVSCQLSVAMFVDWRLPLPHQLLVSHGRWSVFWITCHRGSPLWIPNLGFIRTADIFSKLKNCSCLMDGPVSTVGGWTLLPARCSRTSISAFFLKGS